jgi:hypothetical protein
MLSKDVMRDERVLTREKHKPFLDKMNILINQLIYINNLLEFNFT